ncbi:MAG: ribonuclease J [Clostridiales bacterium]|jgi:ribonuclease J|nr:ribonuclease J [Clostridiales bacterium]
MDKLQEKTNDSNRTSKKRNSHYNGQRNNRNNKKDSQGDNKQFKVIPIGGLKEIGKNCTLVETETEILIIDCGFSFPDDEMFGVDVVIPDFRYLRENRSKIKGLIITHGHEDHIGGIPYLLKEFNIPVYASPLSAALIEGKLKEHRLKANLNVIKAGDIIKVGKFAIEAIQINHSIADAMGFSIKFPEGHIVHTGDFKIDFYPLDGKVIDLNRFSQLGNEGVDLLLADSTNVLREGFTSSEQKVVESINRIFDETDKRIIIATFSSNIYRIKYFMEAAKTHGRRIAISGRSMENVISLAKELGYLDNIPEAMFVDIKRISTIPDGNLLIITTGSQGEPMSALTRMANDMHRAVKLKRGDVVVFSSSPIPGNEKTVTNVVNKLYEKKVEVVLSDSMDVHVSGHACKQELRLIHTLVRPRFFLPVHGEYRHLIEHAKLCQSLGMPKNNIFVMTNGDALQIKGRKATQIQQHATVEDIMVDGYGVGDVGSTVLRDRKQLSQSGLISIGVAIDHTTGALMSRPELTTRGFIYVKENQDFLEECTAVVYNTIGKWLEVGLIDIPSLKNSLRDDLRLHVYKKTKRSPVILPMILLV